MNNLWPLLVVLCISSCVAQTDTSDFQLTEDIAYYNGQGADPDKHLLDLYIPSAVDNPPLMIWIHGGAWAFGGRKQEKALAEAFAREGIAVATVSYRLSPARWANPPKVSGVQHPAHIQDVAQAFGSLYTNAESYGYDQQNMFVSGYSAGGHLSALLALDDRYLNAVGRTAADIRGAIPLAGAYDLVAYYEAHRNFRGQDFADLHVKGVFGDTMDDLEDASVTSWVSSSTIPMLVVAESETTDYTQYFERTAKEENATNISFHYLPEETHQSYLRDLSDPQSSHRWQIVAFINRHLRPHSLSGEDR